MTRKVSPNGSRQYFRYGHPYARIGTGKKRAFLKRTQHPVILGTAIGDPFSCLVRLRLAKICVDVIRQFLKQRQTNVFRDASATKKYNIALVYLTYQFAGDIGAGLGEFHDQQSRDVRDSGQRRFERNEPKIHPTVARWISFANDNHIEPERLVSKQNNLPIRKTLT